MYEVYWRCREGAGAVFVGDFSVVPVCELTRQLYALGTFLRDLSSFIQRERALTDRSGESSVLMSRTEHLLMFLCTTSDCKGRLGPGLVWRMSEVCR